MKKKKWNCKTYPKRTFQKDRDQKTSQKIITAYHSSYEDSVFINKSKPFCVIANRLSLYKWSINYSPVSANQYSFCITNLFLQLSDQLTFDNNNYVPGNQLTRYKQNITGHSKVPALHTTEMSTLIITKRKSIFYGMDILTNAWQVPLKDSSNSLRL